MKKRILAFLLTVMMVVTLLPSVAFAVEPRDSAASVDTAKTAEWEDAANGIAKVTLTVTASDGTVSGTEIANTYIVLVLDTSGSMAYNINDEHSTASPTRMEKVKDAANGFIDNFLPEYATNVKIGVVSYDYYATKDHAFSADAISLKSSIESLKADGGTNIQHGIKTAQDMLDTITDTTAQKIIVVLTDGEPTYSYKGTAVETLSSTNNYNVNTSDFPFIVTGFDNYDKEADLLSVGRIGRGTDYYYSYRVGGSSFRPGSGTQVSNHGVGTVSEAYAAKKAGTTVYSIAYGAGSNGETVMKSVASEGKYYSAAADSAIDSIFDEIARDIEIPVMAGTGATVTDPMGKAVDVYEDGAYGITVPDGDSYEVTSDGNIKWTLGDLTNGEHTMTYYVKFDLDKLDVGVNKNVPTNNGAILEYTNSDEKTATKDFEDPKLDCTVYSLSYNANGGNGTGLPAEKKYFAGSSATVTNVVPERDGYKFLGWSTDKDATTAKYQAGDTVAMTGDTYAIVLYAVWEAKEYKVYYTWSGDIPDGYTAPVDENSYIIGDFYTVDSNYTSSTTVNVYDSYGNVNGVYSFSGWKLNGEGDVVTGTQTMGNSNVTLKGEWNLESIPLETYKITYKWDGTTPTGDYEQKLPDTETGYVLNQPYTVDTTYEKDITRINKIEDGNIVGAWVFKGWDTEDGIMTDDLTITGTWIYEMQPTGSVYKVEYYLETLTAGEYVLDDSYFKSCIKIGETVTATEKTYDGFSYNSEKSNASGEVYEAKVDGTDIDCLTLKLYYTRNSYKVTYEYTGTVPKDATKLPADASYKYGETVTVAKKATATGYTFDGWNTVAKIELTNGTFEMPADNVMFYGSFAPADTTYTVKHYLETGYNTNDYTLEETEVIGGVTGEETKASAKSYDGYVAQAFEQKIVESDGSTVVEIYYDVQKADTYTVTYIVDDKIVGEVEVYEAGDIVTVRKTLPDKQFYTFEGWYFPTYITVKNNKFEMPARDVIIRGEYKYEGLYIPPITEGYIEIEKELTAPKGYTGATTFTFEIYKDGNDDDDLYTTIRVKAGESQKIKVDVGTYYIYEIDAEEEGYTLTTGCNAQNNRIRVEGGKTRTVTFKNVYTEEILLEKDDHFGYIIGYPDDTVRPESNITRAEIATIFFRMLTDESRDAYWCQTNDFTDVSRTDWFNNAVSTLANAGILSGYADGSFRPNASITRAELVKIAVAFYGSDAAVEADFSDTEDHWADMFINAAYGLGFVNGYEDGSFRPDQAVTRAEAMKIINRSLGRYPTVYGLHGDMIIWKDNRDKSAWYYADVQEATNSHEYVWETDTAEDWTDILPVRDWAALEKVYSDAYDG